VTAPIAGFAGLTHLGLVSAAASAAKGFRTIGFDPDGGRVAALKAGSWPISEPQFPELMAQHAPLLSWTASPGDLGACDLVFVAADVPTDEAGASALGPIQSLVAALLPALAPHALLIILCQVPPGFTRSIELAPSRRFYQVETLVFGRAVERALRPERFIIGADDPAAALPAVYRTYLESFSCPLLPMRYESAELAKISINCFLVASVTVTNTLAELSEGVGADWREIAPALKLDARIGPQAYLAPGLGLAGGNLERDLATVRRLAGETGSEAGLIDAMLVNSRHRRDWALRVLHEQLLSKMRDPVIGVLGLAYKENTHSTKNSPSLALIRHLQSWPLRVFDPVVPASAAQHPRCVGCDTALTAAEGVDALVIATPWPEFRHLSAADLAARMRGRMIVDPYRVLAPEAAAAAGVRHFVLGAPPQMRAAELVHA
jgi:UDPglucose 6-dehydrogenase